MGVAIVTGAGGLVGAEAAKFFTRKGLVIVGIDNDMRSLFFGADASTRWSWIELQRTLPFYTHVEADIRDRNSDRRDQCPCIMRVLERAISAQTIYGVGEV